jgi:hypothetical protein
LFEFVNVVDRFASALRAPRFRVSAPLCVGGHNALKHLRASGYLPLYPRGPRSGPGYVVPVHHHLIGPHAPRLPAHRDFAAVRFIRDALAVRLDLDA